MEPGSPVWRIPEVIDIMAFGFEAFDYIWIVWIPPTGGDLDLGQRIKTYY